jgi:hypothetical protein
VKLIFEMLKTPAVESNLVYPSKIGEYIKESLLSFS